MSARVPLPLRWLLSPFARDGRTGQAVLELYKPCGLPYYAQSQLAAVRDGRQLLAIHTPAEAGATRSAPRPLSEDTSDALLTRVLDTLQPGATPYITLPLPSALLLDAQRRTTDSTTSAALVNRWTAAMKGVTLVAQTQGDAFFLRNADQMGLVQYRYRVLARLPRGVGAALRRAAHQHAAASSSSLSLTHDTTASSELTRIARLNPYVQDYLATQDGTHRSWLRRVGLDDLTAAVTTSNGHSTVVSANSYTSKDDDDGMGQSSAGDVYIGGGSNKGCLPSDVQQDPLVRSGLFDIAHATLRRRGRLTCFLRPALALPAELAVLQRHRRRLTRLFMPATTSQVTPNCITNAMREADCVSEDVTHPWLAGEDILRVSLDTASTQTAASAGKESHSSKNVKAARGRAVQLDFELLCVSPADINGDDEEDYVALYEVRSRAAVTAQEVAAAFAACGVYVVNDYVHDHRLARAMLHVAQRMRAAPASALAQLPMRVQHAIREGSPDSLVAQPLLGFPPELVDDYALQQLYSTLGATRHTLRPSSPALPPPDKSTDEDNDEGKDEWLERLGAVLQQRRQQLHPVRQLLFTTLTRSLQQQQDAAVCNEDVTATMTVLPLLLGAGVECVQIAFPDPTCVSNVQALQRVLLQRDERRLSEQTRRELRQTLQYVSCDAGDVGSGSVLLRLRGDSLTPTLLTRNDEPASVHSGGQQRVITSSLSFALALLSPRAAMHALYKSVLGIHDDKHATERSSVNDMLQVAGMNTELMTMPDMYSALLRPHTDVESAAETKPATHEGCTQRVLALMRAEELGEYVCTSCGASGHTWHRCPHLSSPAVVPALPTASASNTHQEALPAESAQVATNEDTVQLRSTEWLSSVAAAESIVAMQDAEKQQRQTEMTHTMNIGLHANNGSYTNNSDEDSLSLVTAVPNVAPTLPYSSDDVRRHERHKPALHRRSVRCAYCHGRHHITHCPRLAGAEEHSAHSDVQEGKSKKSTSDAEKQPFCIKCGQLGHLYTACPKVPSDLHLATHCPICLQPLDEVDHRATQCPQRRRPPQMLSSPAAIPRRQHRHTLLADNFIDKMRRSGG